MKTEANRPVVSCQSRRQWRKWLETHFQSDAEIWLVFPAKKSGEEGISYNDAVEEALCFGWIDSTAGTLDPMHHLRRFTPRRAGSPYSQPNIERLIWLDSRDLIHPTIRESVIDLIHTPYVFPEDILNILRKDGTAWQHYCAFSEPYKRIRVAYIDAARKRPDEFQRRLANFLKYTRQNKLIVGHGGVDKYYSNEWK